MQQDHERSKRKGNVLFNSRDVTYRINSSELNPFHYFSTVNILSDKFVTLLFTISVIMFDKAKLTIILKYLMMLVKTILVLKH